ncbi:MAG: hypothetical protein ABNH16_16160 [Thalassolituus sp.]|jgi:hypothetical protein
MGFKFFGVFVVLLLLFGQAHSDVVILAEQRSPVLDKLAKNLTELIAKDVSHHTLEYAKNLKSTDIVILAGDKAVSQWRGSQPSIAIWVGRTVIDENHAHLSSAIYSEPPVVRQLALARFLFPDARISSIYSNQAEEWLVSELKVAEGSGLSLVLQSDDQTLNYALKKALSGYDVLLGVADSTIYNPSTVKNILISAYRQNIPLIGPHRAYIRAGAIATTYSSLEHTTTRLAEMIMAERLPAVGYNPYFTVMFNEQVARSLNILLPASPEAVAEAIRSL